MQLTLVSKELDRYTLLQNGKETASVKYNRESQTIRVRSAQRRLFFLTPAGILQHRIILKTEYGVEIGENNYVKNNRKGHFHFNQLKFTYTVGANSLAIFEKHRKPVANVTVEKVQELDNYEFSAILFSLAWLLIPEPNNAGAIAL